MDGSTKEKRFCVPIVFHKSDAEIFEGDFNFCFAVCKMSKRKTEQKDDDEKLLKIDCVKGKDWSRDSDAAAERFVKLVEGRGGKVVGQYETNKIRVACICPNGHECEPYPTVVIRGGGMCKTCSNRDSKQTEAKFRARVTELGGTVIGPYKTGCNVPCKCKNGHDCSPMPSSILNCGQGLCMKCVGHCPEVGEQKFRQRIKELGGTVVGPYVNSNTKVPCICKNKHKCSPYPGDINAGRRGMCKKCALHETKAFVNAERKFHDKIEGMGGKVVGKYQGQEGNENRVECICPKGHTCFPLPKTIMNGWGMCDKCTGLLGEGRLKELIIKLTSKEPEGQFKLPPPADNWRFDFFLQDQKKVIELDGDAHFKPIKFFGGEPTFQLQRKRDLAKAKDCFTNGLGMIRIHYNWLSLKEEAKLEFLKAAISSKETLVVTKLDKYQWLKDAGFNPVQINI